MFNLNFIVVSIILSSWFSISGAQEKLKSDWVGRYACAQHKDMANIYELDIELEQKYNVDSRIHSSDLKFSFNKITLVGLNETQKNSPWPFMLNVSNVRTTGLIHLKENTNSTKTKINASQLRVAGKLATAAKDTFNIKLSTTGPQTFSVQINSTANVKTLEKFSISKILLKKRLICTKMVQSSSF